MTKLKCMKKAVIQISEKAGYKCDDIRVSYEDGQARAGLTKTIQDYLKINQRRKMVMSTIKFWLSLTLQLHQLRCMFLGLAKPDEIVF